jgi:hypothetical protein
VDRNLYTGQNPASAEPLARELLKVLDWRVTEARSPDAVGPWSWPIVSPYVRGRCAWSSPRHGQPFGTGIFHTLRPNVAAKIVRWSPVILMSNTGVSGRPLPTCFQFFLSFLS